MGKFKNYIYKFKCLDSEVNISCRLDKTTSMCENTINIGLVKFNSKFNDGVISSLKSINSENGDQLNCALQADKKFACIKENKCDKPIKVEVLFNELNDEPIDACSNDLTTNEKQYKEDSKQLASFVRKESVYAFTNKFCKNLENKEKETIQNSLTSMLNPNFFSKLLSQCLRHGVDQEENLILLRNKLELEKSKIIFQRNLESFINNDFSDCASKSEPLFKNQKLDIDRFVCLSLQKVEFIKDISCESLNSTQNVETFTSKQITQANASRDSAANNDKKLSELGNPIIMDMPKEISQPIPVQETLAQIDQMVKENDGKLNPDIAQRAGSLFQDSIHKPVQSAIEIIDRNVFKPNEASSVKLRGKSNKTAQYSGKRPEIGARRIAPRSANISRSPSALPSAIEPGAGAVVAGTSKTIGAGLGTNNEASKIGAEARDDNQMINNKKLPQNSNSQQNPNNRNQGNNAFLENSTRGPSRIIPDERNIDLTPKDLVEVKQLEHQINAVQTPEDLTSLLGLEENQKALWNLVNPTRLSPDRSPASAKNPLIKKLEEFNVKLFDDRTGETIFTPLNYYKYIIRVGGANGASISKPIGGPRK